MAKATYIDERVNTTFAGYILIGFFLLLVGIFGLQSGNLFGDDFAKWPLSIQVFSGICSILGVIFLILTVLTYRTGQKTSAIMFVVIGMSMLASGLQTGAVLANSNWFMYMALAIVFIVLMIYTILEEEPKLVWIMLLILALVFFFVSLATFFDPIVSGPGNDENVFHALGIVYGIISFIGCVLAMYLCLAYSQPDKLPLV